MSGGNPTIKDLESLIMKSIIKIDNLETMIKDLSMEKTTKSKTKSSTSSKTTVNSGTKKPGINTSFPAFALAILEIQSAMKSGNNDLWPFKAVKNIDFSDKKSINTVYAMFKANGDVDKLKTLVNGLWTTKYPQVLTDKAKNKIASSSAAIVQDLGNSDDDDKDSKNPSKIIGALEMYSSDSDA